MQPIEHGQGDDGASPFWRFLEGLGPRTGKDGIFWGYLWHRAVFVLGIDNVLHGLFYHAPGIIVIDQRLSVEPVLLQPS